MRFNPFGEGRIHHSLAGWTNGDGLGQFRASRSRHPGHLQEVTSATNDWPITPTNLKSVFTYFRCKIIDVSFLFMKSRLRHKHWKITILNSEFLNLSVKKLSNGFPNRIGPRAENIAATYVIIFDHFSFSNNLN